MSTPSAFKPYVPADKNIPEFTWFPVVLGIVLGVLFGTASLYLVLKVGMTVSASIPVAVMSITLFKYFSKTFGLRQATILENNIVQTTGSAGESIAFGVGVTMPALMILGFDMELTRILTVSSLGGLLGILMMIPLRHNLVVQSHKELPFPEGTACAQILIAGEKGGKSESTVFIGFFVGLVYKVMNLGLKMWHETASVPAKAMSFFKGSSLGTDVAPELLGVGYIIGPRIASIMMGGGILAYWVLIPMIRLFGDGLTVPLFPATKLISEMSPGQIRGSYILYIGAGAVATGGLISLFQSLPVIIRSATKGIANIRASTGNGPKGTSRTETDIPLKAVFIGSLVLILALLFAPGLKINLLGAILVVLFGFLFVTVSSRLTGEIGSSSNPISGMTVATLLLTSLIFLGLGWVSADYRVTALCVAAVVCVAASNGGTTAQDLKTGYLIGATPKYQQYGILLGALSSAVAIGFTLNILNEAASVYTTKDLPQVIVPNVQDLPKMQRAGGQYYEDPTEYHVLQFGQAFTEGPLATVRPGKYLVDSSGAIKYLVDPGINGQLSQRDDGTSVNKFDSPKAQLMSLIIDGILSQKLPWGLILLGVSIAIVLELAGISALPFAVGVYLPVAVSAPIFLGGVVKWFVDRKNKESESDMSPGVLLASGLIAGGAIGGILTGLLGLPSLVGFGNAIDLSAKMPFFAENGDLIAVVTFAALIAYLYKVAMRKEA